MSAPPTVFQKSGRNGRLMGSVHHHAGLPHFVLKPLTAIPSSTRLHASFPRSRRPAFILRALR